MRKRTLISLILTVIMIFIASGIASAATWQYYFPITVSDNSSTTRTMYPIILEVGGDSLVDGGYLTANGTDARLRTTADKNLLMSTDNIAFAVDSLPAYGQVTYDLYTGYSPEIDAFQIIVGDGGYVTVADNTTIELGDNFTIEQKGWWDTAAGANKTAVYKEDAVKVYVSDTVSGNITADIAFTETWTSPTGFVDPDTEWADEAKAFDDNTGTFAIDANIATSSWGSFIELTHSAISQKEVRFYASGEASEIDEVDVDVYYGGAWNHVFEGVFAESTWITKTLGDSYLVTAYRFRFHNGDAINTRNAYLHEVDFGAGDPLASVTATGVASGEHTVKTTTSSSCLSFDGNDYVIFPGAVAEVQNLAIGTIEMWVRMTSDTTGNFFAASDVSDATSYFRLFYNATGNLIQTGCAEAGTVFYAKAFTGSEISLATWYHLVFTHNGTTPVLYLDGVAKSIAAGGADYTKFLVDVLNIDDVSSGVINISSGRTAYLDGAISGQRIYNRVLSATEAQEHYNGVFRDETGLIGYWIFDEGTGTTATDSSSSENDGTIVGASWVICPLLRLYIDDVLVATSANVTVPDNANDWTFCRNNVLPYSDNISIEVDRVLELWFEPTSMISGTTLPDRETATNNDGTITWGANDQIIVTFGSVTSYEATTSVATTNTTGFVLPLVGIPDNWWGMEFDGEDLPFYPTFLDTSTQTGIPLQTLYLLMVFGAAIALATVTIVLTRSVLVGVAFYTVTMAYGANAGIVAWWIIYVFLIMVVGIVFLSSRQAMGG